MTGRDTLAAMLGAAFLAALWSCAGFFADTPQAPMHDEVPVVSGGGAPMFLRRDAGIVWIDAGAVVHIGDGG